MTVTGFSMTASWDKFSPYSESKSNSVFSYTKTRSGAKVPNFRGLLAAGRDASSTFSCSDAKHNRNKAYAYAVKRITPPTALPYDRGNIVIREPQPDFNWAPQVIGNARTVALKRLYNRIDDAIGRFQAGVALGEMRETKRMLGSRAALLGDSVSDSLKRLSKEARYLRYVRRLPGARIAARISDLWLEYSFGWRPLIGDVTSLHNSFVKQYDICRIRVSASATESKTVPTVKQVDGFDLTETTTERTVQYLSSFRFAYGLRQPSSALSKWGSTPLDGLSMAWELIPWSFLIDYFVDIGTFIRSFQYSNLQVIYGSEASTNKAIQIVNVRTRAINGAVLFSSIPGSGEFERWSYSRSPSYQVPVFIPSFKLLEGLTVGDRILNVAALIGSRVKSL
jgi:hypothetical protein